MSDRAAAGGYRPQIDGLRALAVAGVLVSHFLWPDTPFGHLGVRLFFVISGFLITERLLVARRLVEGGALGRGWAVAAFFARRALRILPAYLLLLAVLFLAGVDGLAAGAAWHLLNASNLWFAVTGAWEPWPIAHFWSLGVEEQFYAVWPWLVLFLPAARIRPAVAMVAVSGLLFRVALSLSGATAEGPLIWVLPPASFDALGLGALLALAARDGNRAAWRRWQAVAAAAAVAWVALAILIHARVLPDALLLNYALMDGLNALVFAGLVARARDGRADLAGRCLQARPVVGVGRISYGVYLWHLPMLALMLSLWPWLRPGPACFLLATAATLAVAGASWLMWERRWLRLKDRF